MKYALALALALTVAGCQTVQQQIQEREVSADDARCRSYGVSPGSQEYVNCRTALDRNRATRQALQGFGGGSPFQAY